MSENIPISSVINLSITTAVSGIQETGFGTPLILTDEDTYGDSLRVHSYSSLAEVVDEWATSTDAYKMANAIFAQSPAPTTVKIGTEATRVAQIQTVTFSTDIVTGNTVAMTVDGTAITQAFSTDHLTTITALAAQIQALATVSTATVGGSGNRVITVTAQNAGIPVSITATGITGGASQATITVATTTASHGIADDLAEIIDEDNDWYLLLWTEQTLAYVKEAADSIEAYRKQYVSAQADSNILNSANTTDLAYYVKNASLERSRAFYHSEAATTFADAALGGKVLPYDPGATVARYQTLAGITADDLSSTERSSAETKYAFYYGTLGGINVVIEPQRTDGKYFDTIRDRDYVSAYVEEQLASFVIGESQAGRKIPYTQAGIDKIEAQLRKILSYLENTKKVITFEGVDEDARIVFPKIADVSTSDKASRVLNDVSFTCKLQGAIYKFNITGTLTN